MLVADECFHTDLIYGANDVPPLQSIVACPCDDPLALHGKNPEPERLPIFLAQPLVVELGVLVPQLGHEFQSREVEFASILCPQRPVEVALVYCVEIEVRDPSLVSEIRLDGVVDSRRDKRPVGH